MAWGCHFEILCQTMISQSYIIEFLIKEMTLVELVLTIAYIGNIWT